MELSEMITLESKIKNVKGMSIKEYMELKYKLSGEWYNLGNVADKLTGRKKWNEPANWSELTTRLYQKLVNMENELEKNYVSQNHIFNEGDVVRYKGRLCKVSDDIVMGHTKGINYGSLHYVSNGGWVTDKYIPEGELTLVKAAVKKENN